MTEVALSREEAAALLAMEKHRADDNVYEYPAFGGAIHIPLQSIDRRETFTLDVRRSQIKLAKGTYQNRARGIVILARLDFGGPPHRNPDDSEVECPHLHVYREGYGDRWAVPLPRGQFPNQNDAWMLVTDFMRFINVTLVPDLRRGLFA